MFGASVHISRWEKWKEVENYCKLASVDSDETELGGFLLQTGRKGGGDEEHSIKMMTNKVQQTAKLTQTPAAL